MPQELEHDISCRWNREYCICDFSFWLFLGVFDRFVNQFVNQKLEFRHKHEVIKYKRYLTAILVKN